MTHPRRILWFVVVAGAVLLLVPAYVRAQPSPLPSCDLSPFLAPTSWTGSVTTTVIGSGTVTLSAGDTVDYNIHQTIQMSPVLPALGGAFGGAMNASVSVNESYVETIVAPGVGTFTNTTTVAGNGFITLGAGGAPTAILAFSLCNYYLTVQSYPPIAGTITTNGVATPCQCGAGPFGSVVPTAPVWAVPVPSTGTTLSGSTSFDAPAFANFGTGPYPAHITTTWSLTPATDLDVIVTIPAYDTWRPTGGLNEKETGIDLTTGKFNFLEIQAKLVQKSTGQEVSFSPGKWTFSLVQVSHVPGVAMNWPDEIQAGTEPDMTFDKLACATPIGCKSVPPNQLFTITPSDPNFPNGDVTADFIPSDPIIYSSIIILLSPHDWGGWATLNVIATVGSQQILGHLQLPTPLASNANQTDILLPQRQAGSFIADNWKNGKVPLSTPDDDDSESTPTGDGQAGDGLTLFEEYRGFYMGCANSSFPPTPEGTVGCQHVEGDPMKKDLFVVNLMPGVADAGIATFQQASKVKVHWQGLTLDDLGSFDPSNPGAYRVINFNNAGAPHEVDQHALVIRLKTDLEETAEPADNMGVPLPGRPAPGLPKDIDRIQISPTYSDIGPDYTRRMIAHEMSHAVDVYHHGEIDEWVVTWKVDSSGNITENGSTVYVKNEDDDPSIAKTTVPLQTIGFGQNVGTVDVFVGNNVCGGAVVQSGQHSGDVASYMRYVAADAYIPLGFPQIRFWTGTAEPYGFQLTDQPAGTGVNLSTRKPRPRYGDAYDGGSNPPDPKTRRGNDASQLDVNDNNTELVRKDNRCP